MICKGLLLLLVVVAAVSACWDNLAQSTQCGYFRSQGYCGSTSRYYQFMKINCQKTCGFCGGGPNPQTPRPGGGGCGLSQFQSGRVIAGQTARVGAWPWQILMKHNGRAGCGGTLISAEWVVTAAHCVYGKERNPSSFEIVAGDHDRNRPDHEQTQRVSRVIRHRSYNSRNMNNDIALFKLSSPFQLNAYVQPACLPSGPPSRGAKCFITGWGKTRHPGSMTSVLQQAQLDVVSKSVCESRNRQTLNIPITDAMLCAGDGGRTRKSGCHGDSGGPFVCESGGRWTLHGAVSHGSDDCSSRKTYTVFANVNYFRSWITQNTGL